MYYDQKVFESLLVIKKKYDTLNIELEQAHCDFQKVKKINKIIKDHKQLVTKFVVYQKLLDDIAAADKIINDSKSDHELVELAQLEIEENKKKASYLLHELKLLLLPKDANDNKNVIVEIRPAAGGNEANIFVFDLFNMYKKYADLNRWKIKMIEMNSASIGYNFIAFMIVGDDVYAKMKFESGVHRVQRVPVTEAKGRTHTSTVTVAILPEMEAVEVKINQSDLRVDTFRASGAGGQHVNRTESAVRITHLPTNVVVTCQEGKSQFENHKTAMKILRAKLWELENNKKRADIANLRKNQVGSGERAEKIRTYNYAQNRITDHRINLSLVKLDLILENGDLSEITSALVSYNEALKLQKTTI